MITSFCDDFTFLSNFYKTPVLGYNDFLGTSYTFPCVENAYQAAKCSEHNDFVKFLTCTPGQAKRLGRKVKMNPLFDTRKVEIMSTLVTEKFNNNPELAEKLIKTVPYSIVEGNYWHDNFWGMCMCNKCTQHKNTHGRNMLGEILMNIRDELVAGNMRYNYPFTVRDNQVFHKYTMEVINRPSVVYDKETYTIIKAGSYDVCIQTFSAAGTTLPLNIYALDKMTSYGACEVLNCCLAYTGYIKQFIEGA